jgi:hypothetical protein
MENQELFVFSLLPTARELFVKHGFDVAQPGHRHTRPPSVDAPWGKQNRVAVFVIEFPQYTLEHRTEISAAVRVCGVVVA